MVGRLTETSELAEAISFGERLVRHEPLREESYRQLMRLCASKGDRAGALRVYHRCATILRRELEAEPDPETRELRDRVMSPMSTMSPTELAPPIHALAGELPLVGRGSAWRRLLETWRTAASGRASFALITGEPGIGKTRLSEELWASVSRQGPPRRSNALLRGGGTARVRSGRRLAEE